MSNASLDEISNTYLRFCLTHADEDVWSMQEVDKRLAAGLEQGWEITLLLLRKSQTDSALATVAAGPLEEFLEKYQDAGLDRLERAADSDQRLQRALGLVWLEADEPVFRRWHEALSRYGIRIERR